MQNEFELDVENGRGEDSRIILIVSCFLYSFGKTETKSTTIYRGNSTLIPSMSLKLSFKLFYINSVNFRQII